MNDELDIVLKSYNLTNYIINSTNTRSYNKHFEIIGIATILICVTIENHYPMKIYLYEYQILDFLNQSMDGIVPKIILTNNDKVCVEYNNNFYTLFAWLAHGQK
jgi:hypothetical protein